jgi:hypothetical protein
MALRAAARIFLLSATLVPPNFCTTSGMEQWILKRKARVD